MSDLKKDEKMGYKFRWKFFISWIVSVVAITYILGIIGFISIPRDPVTFIAPFVFFGILIIFGYWLEWSGLAKILGWKK
jgi:hypothetical protein